MVSSLQQSIAVVIQVYNEQIASENHIGTLLANTPPLMPFADLTESQEEAVHVNGPTFTLQYRLRCGSYI